MRRPLTYALLAAALLSAVWVAWGGRHAYVFKTIRQETGIVIPSLLQYGRLVALDANRAEIVELSLQITPSDEVAQMMRGMIQSHYLTCLGIGGVISIKLAELGSPLHICMYGYRGWTAALLLRIQRVAGSSLEVQRLAEKVRNDVILMGQPSRDVCEYVSPIYKAFQRMKYYFLPLLLLFGAYLSFFGFPAFIRGGGRALRRA